MVLPSIARYAPLNARGMGRSPLIVEKLPTPYRRTPLPECRAALWPTGAAFARVLRSTTLDGPVPRATQPRCPPNRSGVT